MRQLEMLDEAGRLHIVRMRHHEFFVLRRRNDFLAELAGAQRAIDQRHRHGLALALAERQPIAAREARRFRGRALELVDHLAFGQRDRAERHREADVFGQEFDLDLAEADLAGKGMVAAVAALRGIAKRQQKAFVAARQILQAQIAIGREAQRLAREVADRRSASAGGDDSIRPSRPRISVTRGVVAVEASRRRRRFRRRRPRQAAGSSRRWV